MTTKFLSLLLIAGVPFSWAKADDADATRLITQADINNLSSTLTLAEAYKKWGKPDIDGQFIVTYYSDFYDFQYRLVVDSDKPLDVETLKNGDGKIVSIYRKEIRFNPNPRLIWTSETYYPKCRIAPTEIDSLPPDSDFKFINKHVPCGKMGEFNKFVAVATCRAPVSGYVYEFFFLIEGLAEGDRDSAKLASVYIVSEDGNVRALRWGKIINPFTGKLLPDRTDAPFGKQVELPGFLYSK